MKAKQQLQAQENVSVNTQPIRRGAKNVKSQKSTPANFSRAAGGNSTERQSISATRNSQQPHSKAYSGVSFSRESHCIEDFNQLASNAKTWLVMNAGRCQESPKRVIINNGAHRSHINLDSYDEKMMSSQRHSPSLPTSPEHYSQTMHNNNQNGQQQTYFTASFHQSNQVLSSNCNSNNMFDIISGRSTNAPKLPNIDTIQEEQPEECTVPDDDEEEHINYDDHHKTNGKLRQNVSARKRGGLQAYNNPQQQLLEHGQNSVIRQSSIESNPYLESAQTLATRRPQRTRQRLDFDKMIQNTQSNRQQQQSRLLDEFQSSSSPQSHQHLHNTDTGGQHHSTVVATPFSHHSNALSNFYSDKLSKIQKLQDTAKNKLIGLKCIKEQQNIMIEDDSETEANNNADLKGDIYAIKNSARKNTVNNMEFENGKHFMSGKSTVTLQVDNTFAASGPNNVHTLKLSLLKLQPVPTDSSPKDGVNLTAQKSPRDGSRNNRDGGSNQPMKQGSTQKTAATDRSHQTKPLSAGTSRSPIPNTNPSSSDPKMSHVTDYVDANIAMLQMLLQQKRKLNICIEERKIAHQATLNEINNFNAQFGLLNQDQEITFQRHNTLISQTHDLESQIRQLCVKIVEKSDEYQHMMEEESSNLQFAQDNLASTEEEMRIQSNLEQEKLRYQSEIIEELQAKLKGKDREQDKLRTFRDRETSKERLRQHRIIDKGRDIMTIIQDDVLSSSKNNLTNQTSSIFPKNSSLCNTRSIEGGFYIESKESQNYTPSIMHQTSAHTSINKQNMRSQPRQQQNHSQSPRLSIQVKSGLNHSRPHDWKNVDQILSPTANNASIAQRRSITPILARPDSSSQTRLSVCKTSVYNETSRLENSQDRSKRGSVQKSTKLQDKTRQSKNQADQVRPKSGNTLGHKRGQPAHATVNLF